MPLTNGNWWDIGRPVVKGQTDVETGDLATSAVTAEKMGANAVTADKLSTGSVLSEKLSANALRRSVVCQLPDLAAGSTDPLTSAFTVWKPSKAVQVVAFSMIPQAAWVQTTLQTTMVGTLYAGAGAAVGTLSIPSSSGPVRGAVVAGTVSTPYSVAAGQALTFGMTAATSAGYDQPAAALQIDFDSTE